MHGHICHCHQRLDALGERINRLPLGSQLPSVRCCFDFADFVLVPPTKGTVEIIRKFTAVVIVVTLASHLVRFPSMDYLVVRPFVFGRSRAVVL
jgi:hypothetical protein